MKPLYEQVYESLKKDIVSERYKTGDQVPSEKELATTFQVSRITSKKALEKLAEEGFIYRKRGRGSFVKDSNQMETRSSHAESEGKPLFGLIVTAFDDSFGSGLITSIVEGSRDKCHFILKCSFGIPENEEKLVKELLDDGIEGLIVFPAKAEHYSSEILKMVINKFPFILIDRSFKGIAANSVSTDNKAAAKKGIDYLINKGHQEIGVLMPYYFKTTTIDDRLHGIVEAFSEKQLRVNRKIWCYDLKSTLPTPLAAKEEDIKVIKHFIRKHQDITALFALEYKIAVLAKVALTELSIEVPNDMSIICFDSPPWNTIEWNFTHLKQNENELGKLATQRLLAMYSGESQIVNERIPAKLIIGPTTSSCAVKDDSGV
ncbi:GntR family transcriptional regulator [Virgibacillus salexigens]|uniref:GntR family transcriptional regulator n=1 Tax=Virgibacillus salexigens TaxID=61016 RepID=UPI00190D5340|nr:GntR family transcriptional regulator [Virgibacillus salexigens]